VAGPWSSWRAWSPRRVAGSLLGLALVVRLAELVLAGAVVPADNAGDVVYFTRLVQDPWAHLHHSSALVAQYAPYLGFLLWATAKPWLALGLSATTAFRLGSMLWDLLGMALLLWATARRFPRCLWFVGLMWALSPLVLPASAYAGQDETVSGAIVAAMVLLWFERRRCAAIALGVLGLFLAKVLLLPVLAGLLLCVPRPQRVRAYVTAGATFLGAVVVTWLASGTDGITQQVTYSTNDLGFSISFWSTLVLHHSVAANTAIHVSIVLVVLAVVAVVAVWSRRAHAGALEGPRLAAALMLVTLALLAVSNPEYLVLAAPVAIVGGLGLGWFYLPGLLVLASGAAWAINLDYYLFRRAYDPTGTLLGETGVVGPEDGHVRLLDVTHQALLALFLVTMLLAVRHLLRRAAPVDGERDEDEALAELAGG
jgi:hypothetical protein